MDSSRRVHGVDFSGAANAGEKIWVATGEILGDTLQVLQCRPALQLPGGSADLEPALHALRAFIVGQPGAVFGLDFPFGLPEALVEEGTWEEFVLAFSDHYVGPDEFRAHCRQAGGVHELKRATDRNAHTPFSPYNLRVYKQTYYGIRDVLRQMVQHDQARVLPMQEQGGGKPILLEVCPRSTLINMRLNRSPCDIPGRTLRLSHRGRAQPTLRARRIHIRLGNRKHLPGHGTIDALGHTVLLSDLSTFGGR